MKFITVFAFAAIAVAVAQDLTESCWILDDPEAHAFSGREFSPPQGSGYQSFYQTASGQNVQIEITASVRGAPLTVTSLRIQGPGREPTSTITINPTCVTSFSPGNLTWDKDGAGYFATTLDDGSRLQVMVICLRTKFQMSIRVNASKASVQASNSTSICREEAAPSGRGFIENDSSPAQAQSLIALSGSDPRSPTTSVCTISGDPHIKSFSGYTYSDYSDDATMYRELYKNAASNEDVSVQTRRTNKYQDLLTVHTVRITVGRESINLDGNQQTCQVSLAKSRGFEDKWISSKQPENNFWRFTLPSGVQVFVQAACEADSYFALAVAVQGTPAAVAGSTGFCAAVNPAPPAGSSDGSGRR